MIASMTAFACANQEATWGSVTWEIRAVNHRYLELAVRLPEPLRGLEKSVRELIQGQVQRGKVDAQLRFQSGQETAFAIAVNQPLAHQLAQAAQTMNTLFPNAQVNLFDALAWPGVLQTREQNMEIVNAAILGLLRHTLADLVATRRREGEGIKTFIETRLATMQTELQRITERMPQVLELARSKMRARFAELALDLDQERLEQEMVWLAQKFDIAEELQRLAGHVTEVQRVLNRGGVIGRRLDFLSQELNREANTIGSKSADATVTRAVIELRVQIEQIREQVQNIE